jgi:hypothetical protein
MGDGTSTYEYPSRRDVGISLWIRETIPAFKGWLSMPRCLGMSIVSKHGCGDGENLWELRRSVSAVD